MRGLGLGVGDFGIRTRAWGLGVEGVEPPLLYSGGENRREGVGCEWRGSVKGEKRRHNLLRTREEFTRAFSTGRPGLDWSAEGGQT